MEYLINIFVTPIHLLTWEAIVILAMLTGVVFIVGWQACLESIRKNKTKIK
jgi:hypothetical protein